MRKPFHPVALSRSSLSCADKQPRCQGRGLRDDRQRLLAASCARGALPAAAAGSGAPAFVALDLAAPLDAQLQRLDILLHKATDFILDGSSAAAVRFCDGMEDLLRYLPRRRPSLAAFASFGANGLRRLDCRRSRGCPRLCVVDPVEKVLPLVDRASMQAIMSGLHDVAAADRLRAPRHAQVSDLAPATLSRALDEAGIGYPVIVKPRIACGDKDAHSMAVIFSADGWKGLRVQLPAIVQEYVSHGGRQHKCYVLGARLFVSERHSTPDASSHGFQGCTAADAVAFDSLKSLPTMQRLAEPQQGTQAIDHFDNELAVTAADSLREKLGLTFFGFDILVQVGTGVHYVVDINYFPTFKDVPPAETIPAFWEALRIAWINFKGCQLH
eukprot:SM000231S07485  [mRNA]  locus=s231:51331:54209:- [translate_table: standard]